MQDNLSVRDTTLSHLPPCALVRAGEGIVSGTYQLEPTQAPPADAGEPAAALGPAVRHGTLDLYDKKLGLLTSHPTPSAILDVREYGQRLVTAHSTGEVRIFELDGRSFCEQSVVQLADPSVLVLQIAVDESNDRIAATLSNGEVVLLDAQTQQPLWRSPSHSLEAWACAFDVPGQPGLYSGADDSRLCYHDTRTGNVEWELRHHTAGVTSVLPWAATPTALWTGGYDDHLRIVDPQMRRARAELKLGGGVWRLVPNAPASADPTNLRVLACCMYGGLRVLEPKHTAADPHALPEIVGILTNNDSMVYGGAWLDADTGVTCSFYDRVVQTWAAQN